jgi:acetyl-CoA acetyltransferase
MQAPGPWRTGRPGKHWSIERTRRVEIVTKVLIAGVGMTEFHRPGKGPDYTVLGREAAVAAIRDAGLNYRDIQHVYAGYVFGGPVAGQRVIYQLGLTGVPVVNVNNTCATGSTALFLARQAILSGQAECVLALGFEQMAPGPINLAYADYPSPLGRHLDKLAAAGGRVDGASLPEFYGYAGREYQQRYGTLAETFGRIAVKARRHAANNPRALFRTPVTLEEVMASPPLCPPITRLQACPPTCGGAAAVLCTEAFARKHGLTPRVEIVGQALETDHEDVFSADSMLALIGPGMAAAAATKAYEQAGWGPRDAQVIELHDCFTVNELVMYEALGLAEEGEAEKLVCDGDNTYGGAWVVNPCGGLLSKGHPLGATGMAQCFEVVEQLRGNAQERQVDGARRAIQHNLGLGGACVVTAYAAV